MVLDTVVHIPLGYKLFLLLSVPPLPRPCYLGLIRWEEGMFEAAKKVARPEAIPYKMKLHAFRAGRVSFAPTTPMESHGLRR